MGIMILIILFLMAKSEFFWAFSKKLKLQKKLKESLPITQLIRGILPKKSSKHINFISFHD